MSSRKFQVIAAGCIVLLAASFFLAPLVAYSQQVDMWYAYKNGFTSCTLPSGFITEFAEAAYNKCLASYKYPPANLTGYASLAYKLLGLGGSPFPSQVLVTQGNYSVLAYFSGNRMTAAEDVGGANLTIDPPNVVEIQNVSIVQTIFKELNVTVELKNVGATPITGPIAGTTPYAEPGAGAVVNLQLPGWSFNSTEDGVTWIGTVNLGTCPSQWPPDVDCRLSQLLPDLLTTNKTFTYYVEVAGSVSGRPFFYREGSHSQYPPYGITATWVNQFIMQVNEARGDVKLTENNTLDEFAAMRFKTAVAQPDISDYDFAPDAATFFGAVSARSNVAEVLLYPGTSDPATYVSYLQTYAPGHWSGLTSADYSRFGYYVGTGPYESVELPCSLSEIPSAGLNITQFFEQAGCSVSLVQTTWLVVILGD